MAECPGCGRELAAPLAAAGRPARCTGCGNRFLLPSADTLFANAAVYLMANEVDADERAERELRAKAG
ncbi:MAG: hypothetical protein AAGG38_15235 [Planctomycetota bacterium]